MSKNLVLTSLKVIVVGNLSVLKSFLTSIRMEDLRQKSKSIANYPNLIGRSHTELVLIESTTATPQINGPQKNFYQISKVTGWTFSGLYKNSIKT